MQVAAEWPDALPGVLLSALQAAGASGEACHWLGQMCEHGLGLPAADYEQAAAWYGHGAALQHAASAHALAFALENGLGKQ
jgi:TPR repeat protein